MNTIEDIVNFCVERFPKYREWPEGRLKAWLQWYIADGRFACITEGGKIAGVGLIRALDNLEERKDRYHHSEAGQIVWVEFGATSNRHALAALWLECLMRLGWRKSAAFGRCEHNAKIRIYPFHRITHLILTRSLPHAF